MPTDLKIPGGRDFHVSKLVLFLPLFPHGEKCIAALTLARVRVTKRNSKLWTGQLDGRI